MNISVLRLFQNPLLWRHNGSDSVPNHQPHDCLLNRLFRQRWKRTSKLRITGLCAGNSPVTGEFPSQRASNVENVSIWWRHHIAWITWKGTLCKSRNNWNVLACSWHELTSFLPRMNNYIHYKMWAEITYPFSKLKGTAVEVWKWATKWIPHFTGHMITFPYWDLS